LKNSDGLPAAPAYIAMEHYGGKTTSGLVVKTGNIVIRRFARWEVRALQQS
jgi:hypothetical protein